MFPLHIVLVKPEIPNNTGAIGRICVGLDCHLHLIQPLGFHLTNHYVQRAGLDYWEHLRLTIHDGWHEFLNIVNPPRLFFLSTHGSTSLYECSFQPHDAVIVVVNPA